MDQLCLPRLLPYSTSEVVLPWEDGEEGLKMYPFLQETLWESSKEKHPLSDSKTTNGSLIAPSLSQRRLPDGGKIWLSPIPTIGMGVSLLSTEVG